MTTHRRLPTALAVTALTAASAFAAPSVSAANALPDPAGYDGAIAWLPDTQYYSAMYPQHFSEQTRWLVDNAQSRKISYAAHTGDIVDLAGAGYQWDNADEATKTLDDAKFPYGVVEGNHDRGGEYAEHFGQQRFGRPSDAAGFLAPFFKRAAYVGLQDSLRTVADVDRYWQRYFPGTDWRGVSVETALPGYLNDLMAATNDLSNQQLVAAVKELTAKGERVFVVCGSSHAFCVAPSFGARGVALLPSLTRDLAER